MKHSVSCMQMRVVQAKDLTQKVSGWMTEIILKVSKVILESQKMPQNGEGLETKVGKMKT